MKKVISLIILSVLMISLASAFMPPTHKYIQNELEKQPIATDLYNKCMNDTDLCFAGNIMADVSVIFYYTEGQKYVATHNPIFCESMLQAATNDDELACAIGACLHQTQDMVSHTKMVTHSITKTGIVNEIIHVFSEQHMDNIIQKRSPGIKEKALNVSRFNECRPLLKRVLLGFDAYKGTNSADLDQVFDKFLSEVSSSITSYDPSFRKKNGLFDNFSVIPPLILMIYLSFTLLTVILLILLIFRKNKTILNYLTMIGVGFALVILVWIFIANAQGVAFETFVKFITPLSNIVPIGNADAYLSEAISNGRTFFKVGEGFLINTDASGFAQIELANSKIRSLDYIILGVIILAISFLVYVNFRRKPQKGVSIQGL